MAKERNRYACNACGGLTSKWQGQCPHCLAWNTLVEQAEEGGGGSRFEALAATSRPQYLADVQARELPRLPTGISEFDRVLGGGLVDGAVVLLGGDPGIGKSTLLLQAMAGLADALAVFYVSGEESPEQIALRAGRLGLGASRVRLLAEIQLERILKVFAEEKPRVAVVDSVQTVYTEALQSAPGSVAQVRECAARLTRHAKAHGTIVIMVGHVTKEGAIAGPRVLEHIVDTVLYFEGDSHTSFRQVRAFKNRFGAVNELGVFAMTEAGLKEVRNPSAMFLSHHDKDVSGMCVMVAQEGSRPFLVEIQALVDDSPLPTPRRLAVGLEPNRLAMLLAVLHRHAGVPVTGYDVFLNAVGGVRINEPAADLPVLAAIVSSLKNRALPQRSVVFGEIGLAGEVRPVERGQERLKEAAKLGFKQAVVPWANRPRQAIEGIEVVPVRRIDEALGALFP